MGIQVYSNERQHVADGDTTVKGFNFSFQNHRTSLIHSLLNRLYGKEDLSLFSVMSFKKKIFHIVERVNQNTVFTTTEQF